MSARATWEEQARADGWRREGGLYVRRSRTGPPGLEEVWNQSSVAELYGRAPSRAVTRSVERPSRARHVRYYLAARPTWKLD